MAEKSTLEPVPHARRSYIFVLKGNQGKLHENVQWFFDEALKNKFKNVVYDYWEESENHGRIETHKCWLTSEVEWFTEKSDWKNFTTIVLIESHHTIKNKKTVEKRYYICGLAAHAEKITLLKTFQ